MKDGEFGRLWPLARRKDTGSNALVGVDWDYYARAAPIAITSESD